jgi:hypothetical protein
MEVLGGMNTSGRPSARTPWRIAAAILVGRAPFQPPAGGDIRRYHLRNRARVEQQLSLAGGAMAVTAAARGEDVSAARERLRIARDRQRRVRDRVELRHRLLGAKPRHGDERQRGQQPARPPVRRAT